MATQTNMILPPHVYIVDHDAGTRTWAACVLQNHGVSIGIYSDGSELLQEEEEFSPGCILFDLPNNALQGLAILTDLSRGSGNLPVVMTSSAAEIETAVVAMRLGAKDFLERPLSEDQLLAALSAAWQEAAPHLSRKVASAKVSCLSAREREILQAVLAGHSNRTAATSFGISLRTVETYRANMMKKLEVHCFAEAVQMAINAELPPLAEQA